MALHTYFQTTFRTPRALKAHPFLLISLPMPLHVSHLHPSSAVRPSIAALSQPAVCDFPHMQSRCPLHCFVFKEGDGLSKPREIAPPAIICIIITITIMFNPAPSRLYPPPHLLKPSLYCLYCLFVSLSVAHHTRPVKHSNGEHVVTTVNSWKMWGD